MRVALAIAAAIAMAWLAWLVGRADAHIGAPLGADRIIEALPPARLPPDAEVMAQQALRVRPLDGRAYRVLAQVAEAGGDADKSAQLYGIAAKRWPRERTARAKLAQQAFAAGDPAAGLVHLDALLRVAPDISAEVLAALMPAMAEPVFREAMVQRLQLDPPWRRAMPKALLADTTPADAALALLQGLAAQKALTEGELAANITLLERLGHPAEARQAWLSSLATAQRMDAGLLFDGGFERPEVTGGYGWRYRAPPGVAVGMSGDDPLQGEHAMALEFSGRAVRFDDLAQFLALPPGRYQLQAAALDRTDSSRPFVWRVACTGDGRSLLDLPLQRGEGWMRVSDRFEVPPDCPKQELRLRHTSRSLGERQFRGMLRLDAMSITPST